MPQQQSRIKRGLPSTTSITDSNLKRIIDSLILEIRRLQEDIKLINRSK